MPGVVEAVNPSLAPVHTVPQERVVSIEHPCIVRNFDNGIKSLGGEPQIKHVLEHRVGESLLNPERPQDEPIVGVSLRPQDPLAKKISSTGIESRNVLVKVTLPKRTGRKRKRGSDDPFTQPSQPEARNHSITAPDFLQRLQDNRGKYELNPVGLITDTHRFRNLPDFQLIASDNAMMQELVSHAFKPSYDSLRNLKIDLKPGAAHIDSWVAPPSFMAATQPYRYEFTQAAGVKFEQDASGKVTTVNIQAPPRRAVIAVEPDCAQVPQGPPANLKRHQTYGTYLEEAIKAVADLLEKRPLVTRRVAMNYIPQFSDQVFKEATQWVGYSFRAGPWRDSLIKYGVDPRKDPKYRAYQTLMFQLDRRADVAAKGNIRKKRSVASRGGGGGGGWQSHIFDGENVTHTGKTWQICDVSDPLLKSLFDTTTLQEECDVHQFGWYHNGTLCKARVIMRDKMDFLFRGAEPPQAEYEKIARMPDRITRDKLAETYLEDAEAGSRSVALAVEVRSMARLGAKNHDLRVKDRRVRAALEGEQGGGGGLEGAVDGDGDGDGDEDEDEAIDPALMGDGVEDEALQGDFEADDDDEDADADLEAVGNMRDGDGDGDGVYGVGGGRAGDDEEVQDDGDE